MSLNQYIINDIKPLSVEATTGELQHCFNQLTYSHLPLAKEEVYVGCVSETDAYCFDANKQIADYSYTINGFYVRANALWLDVLEAFAQNDCNIMPVLSSKNEYLGYYELHDIMTQFNHTPFFSNPGGIIIVEKGVKDYSFSEISQIVESNNAKLLGAFISKNENDLTQITIKVNLVNISDILQAFRRYGYVIVSGHEEDSLMKTLRDRSDYLDKYLKL